MRATHGLYLDSLYVVLFADGTQRRRVRRLPVVRERHVGRVELGRGREGDRGVVDVAGLEINLKNENR